MKCISILVINSILLFCVTILFSYHVVTYLNFRKILHSGLSRLSSEFAERRFQREVKKYSRTLSIKMGLVEKVELFLIDKSNIRHYIPFMNFYTLSTCSLTLFIFICNPVYGILHFVPTTVVISFLFSLLPVFALDLMGRYNSEKIRRRLAEFISVLNRWCAVKEDIFYAFEKSMESGLGEPLKTFVRDMVIQVSRGIEPLEALDILQLKVDNIQFRDFIANIKQNIRHRGDIRKLLGNLENQFYKIEEEYNRRRISTYRDRLVIYCVMFSVLFIGYYFLKLNPRVEEFYLGTMQGKFFLTFFSILYAIGFYLTSGITKFRY